MKPRLYHFIGFTMVLMTLMVFSAQAQEGMPNNEIPDLVIHPETNLHEEKPLLFEPEKSTSNSERTSQTKEQSAITSKSTKTKGTEASKNPGAKTEDDALSFNFLYYIIQKFKISDIVEQ
ncbi:MAG: hypothetical protein RI909_1572 [Bacteroidota bacterium]|jgi:hypothetical protein